MCLHKIRPHRLLRLQFNRQNGFRYYRKKKTTKKQKKKKTTTKKHSNFCFCLTNFLVMNDSMEFCFNYCDTAVISSEWGTGKLLLRAITEVQQGLMD